MTRVYGRVYVKDTDESFSGEILFEPVKLAYFKDRVLWTIPAHRLYLDEQGRFEVDLLPERYYVYLNNTKVEIEVPMVNEITLKELLPLDYEKQ